MQSLSEGRNEDAWRDLLTCYRISKHLTASGELLVALVGIAVRNLAHDAAILCITEPELDEAAMKLRWSELAPLLTPMRDVMRRDRLAQVDAILRLKAGTMKPHRYYEDAIGFDESETPMRREQLIDGFVELVQTANDVNGLLRRLNRYYDRIDEVRSTGTLAVRSQALEQLHDQLLAEGNRRTLLIKRTPIEANAALVGLLVPPAHNAFEIATARFATEAALLNASFAAELHHLRTDTDVQSGVDLARITSEMANELGIAGVLEIRDYCADEPLKVRTSDSEVLIYSVGVNLKDDGGRSATEAPGADDVLVRLPREK
jgi:hypothetical protein